MRDRERPGVEWLEKLSGEYVTIENGPDDRAVFVMPGCAGFGIIRAGEVVRD